MCGCGGGGRGEGSLPYKVYGDVPQVWVMFLHLLVFIRVIIQDSKYCFGLSFANSLYLLQS